VSSRHGCQTASHLIRWLERMEQYSKFDDPAASKSADLPCGIPRCRRPGYRSSRVGSVRYVDAPRFLDASGAQADHFASGSCHVNSKRCTRRSRRDRRTAQSLSRTMVLSHPGANLLRKFFATPDRVEALANSCCLAPQRKFNCECTRNHLILSQLRLKCGKKEHLENCTMRKRWR
jgi:hypothetical protein